MRRYDDPDRSVNAREFRDRRDILHVTHTRAAVFRWKNYPQQAELAQFLDRRQREFASFIPFHDVRRNLAFGKLAHRLLQVQLLIVQLEVQVISSLLDATVCGTANFQIPCYARDCNRWKMPIAFRIFRPDAARGDGAKIGAQLLI